MAKKFADCERRIDKLSINGITTTSYITGYANRRVNNNSSSPVHHQAIVNQPSKMITLHISKENDPDGKSIGSMADENCSVTVYKPNDFDPANPVYRVKVWDEEGNVTERMVDISKVDPKSCDTIDMFAYSSHLTDSGECKDAQSAFLGISHFEGYNKLFDKKDWFVPLKNMMQMQYDAGNLKGYWDFKKFWDFLTK